MSGQPQPGGDGKSLGGKDAFTFPFESHQPLEFTLLEGDLVAGPWGEA